MTAATLPVSEIFGPTWQGEGPSAGNLAAFVRLGHCNLSCTWCDTAYAWDIHRYDLNAELTTMTIDAIAARLTEIPAGLVVLTGGEPLLHRTALADLAAVCQRAGQRLEIETNGTILPTRPLQAAIDRFNVSPKLAHSGMPMDRRIRPDVLNALRDSGKAVFKFVVESLADLTEVADLEQAYNLAPIWIMPRGETSADVLCRMRALADAVLAHGWHLSSRLHVLLWEASRGR